MRLDDKFERNPVYPAQIFRKVEDANDLVRLLRLKLLFRDFLGGFNKES